MSIWKTKFPDILDDSMIYIEYCNQEVEILPIKYVDRNRYVERWAYLSDIRKVIEDGDKYKQAFELEHAFIEAGADLMKKSLVSEEKNIYLQLIKDVNNIFNNK